MTSKRSQRKGDRFYLSPAWRALKSTVLRRDRYRCAHCGALCLGKKKGQPAPHVDHIIDRRERPDLAMNPSNLQTLCHPCHSKKTRAGQLDRPEIGTDGYPVAPQS